jgi:hypothetical protein
VRADLGQSTQVIVCPVPREQLPEINLAQYVEQEGYQLPWSGFSPASWSLERSEVKDLMQKIQLSGSPLKEFSGVKPLYELKTGFNEAFLIDDDIRNELVKSDPKCAEVIKPYLRGQDIERWIPGWKNLWIILLKSSSDQKNWGWTGIKDIDAAEEAFRISYPSLHQHFKRHEAKLKSRADQGVYWWELRSCAYYSSFEKPKIIYQVIQTLPQYAFDDSGSYGNDKTFILPIADLYLLGLLNSPFIWWYSHRVFTKMLSDAISPMGYLFENLPIAPPTDEIRSQVEPIVSRLIEITKANQEAYRDVLDWLRSRFRIEKPGQKLETFATLTLQEMHDEVRKRIPKQGRKTSDPLGVAGLKEVTQAYNDYALPIQTRTTEAQTLEHRLSDLINQAYGLTPEEIDFMWKTAPPRMPI